MQVCLKKAFIGFDWGMAAYLNPVKAFFIFMATVKERFEKLGLVFDNSMLSAAGAWVSTAFIENNLFGRWLQDQTDGDKTFKVWSYPDDWVYEMDNIIIKFTSKPSESPIIRKESPLPDIFIAPRKRPRIKRNASHNETKKL